VIARCPFGRWVPELGQLICSYNRSAIVLDPESGAVASIRVARADGTAGELLAGTAFLLIDRRYLVYLTSNGTLLAARYDPEKHLAYRPVSLLGGMRREALGEGQFDIAPNGTLVYAPGVDATIGRLVTLHAGGVIQPLPMESGDFQRFDLSHDRRWGGGLGAGQRIERAPDLRPAQRPALHLATGRYDPPPALERHRRPAPPGRA
jgi:hypothetical protein